MALAPAVSFFIALFLIIFHNCPASEQKPHRDTELIRKTLIEFLEPISKLKAASNGSIHKLDITSNGKRITFDGENGTIGGSTISLKGGKFIVNGTHKGTIDGENIKIDEEQLKGPKVMFSKGDTEYVTIDAGDPDEHDYRMWVTLATICMTCTFMLCLLYFFCCYKRRLDIETRTRAIEMETIHMQAEPSSILTEPVTTYLLPTNEASAGHGSKGEAGERKVDSQASGFGFPSIPCSRAEGEVDVEPLMERDRSDDSISNERLASRTSGSLPISPVNQTTPTRSLDREKMDSRASGPLPEHLFEEPPGSPASVRVDDLSPGSNEDKPLIKAEEPKSDEDQLSRMKTHLENLSRATKR